MPFTVRELAVCIATVDIFAPFEHVQSKQVIENQRSFVPQPPVSGPSISGNAWIRPFENIQSKKTVESSTAFVYNYVQPNISVSGTAWYVPIQHIKTPKIIQDFIAFVAPQIIMASGGFVMDDEIVVGELVNNYIPPESVPQTGTFPPSGPTTQTQLLPSYIYQEYSDDDDLQAFAASYNSLAQQYINTLNSLNLPIYTSDNSLI